MKLGKVNKKRKIIHFWWMAFHPPPHLPYPPRRRKKQHSHQVILRCASISSPDDQSSLTHSHMFHSEILSPWGFLTFWKGLPGIGRQLCIKMWFCHFSTRKIYVVVHGKFSEPHFVASFFSNLGEKVWKARKTMGQSFPCFSNLLPGIGEKQSNKVWFSEFSTHRDIYFVCGKMPEPCFDA